MRYQSLRFSQYRTEELLGEGGMGSIYKGYDDKLQRQVVVKILKSNLCIEAQLRREAHMLAQINHPNVMQVYELFTLGQNYALVGEYIAGQSLKEYLHSRVVPLAEKLDLLMQIADGMAAVHHTGVIHGDITLNNVVINDAKQAKVVDFGLASLSAAQLSCEDHHSLPAAAAEGDALGVLPTASFATVAAMAPEQIRALQQMPSKGLVSTVKSDLFAYGTLAFEVLSGDKPFFGSNDREYLRAVVTGNYCDPSNIYPVLPPPLVLLLRQLLSVQPSQRPSSFEQVAGVIKHNLRGLTQQNMAHQNTLPIGDLPLAGCARRNCVSLAPTELQASSNSFSYGGIGFAAAAVVVTLISCVWLFVISTQELPQQRQKKQTHDADAIYYVALHRPIATGQPLKLAEAGGTTEDIVAASLDHGLRQAIVAHPQLNLLARYEVPQSSETIADFMQRSSAHLVLQPRVTCAEHSCQVLVNGSPEPSRSGAVVTRWSLPQKQLLTHSALLSNYLNHWIAAELASIFPALRPLQPDRDSSTAVRQQVPAEQHYRDYLAVYQDVDIYGNKTDQNLQTLTDLLQQSPHLYPAYTTYRELALNLFHNENNHVYIEQLNTVLASAPEPYRNSAAYSIDRLLTALYQRQFKRAEMFFLQAQRRGADRLTLAELRATAYLQQNLPERAIPELRQALALRLSTEQLFNLALAYWYAGDYTAASKQLERLLQVSSENRTARRFLASVYLITGRIPQAVAILHTLIEGNPQSIDLSNLALAYSLQGKFQVAEEYASRAVSISPQRPLSLLNLADVYWYLGKYDAAIQRYQQVLDLVADQRDLQSLLMTAQARSHLGQPYLAVAAINEATKQAPDNGEVAYIAALVASQIQEWNFAIARVKEALQAGVDPIWFHLPWFAELCSQPQYRQLFTANTSHCH